MLDLRKYLRWLKKDLTHICVGPRIELCAKNRIMYKIHILAPNKCVHGALMANR